MKVGLQGMQESFEELGALFEKAERQRRRRKLAMVLALITTIVSVVFCLLK